MIEPVVLIYRSEPIVLERSPHLRLIARSDVLTIPTTDFEAIGRHNAYARSMNRTLREEFGQVRSDPTVRTRSETLERILMNAHAALSISEALRTDRTLHQLCERYSLTSSIYTMYAYALIDCERTPN
jgi:hypothetical protein